AGSGEGARAGRRQQRGGSVLDRSPARRTAGGAAPRADVRGRDARVAEPRPRDARGRVRAEGRRHGRRRAMRAAGIVAIAVFRESVRDKVFYNLVLFALLLLGASILIGQLTAGPDVQIIQELGLAASLGVRS